jgi:hypothetical protein
MLGNRSIYHDGWVAATTPITLPWELSSAPPPDVITGYKWELYNVQEDPTQFDDLAAKMPEKVKEMQALFDVEAKKYNVLPLDNSSLARWNAPRPSLWTAIGAMSEQNVFGTRAGAALRAFWNARRVQEMSESYQRLNARQILDENSGPQMLGVLLSCASGYADLPPGATIAQEGLFRALLDCRVVLRSLRSLAALLGVSSPEQLENVRLEYDALGADLKSIPPSNSPPELARWADRRERDAAHR